MKNYKNLQNGSDIRGVALDGVENEKVNLTSEAAADLAGAFALWLEQKTGKTNLKIAVGTDSRLSAESLLNSCIGALEDLGVTVLNCHMASTPAMFMATQFEETACDGAIMLTASHLPFNRNGLKLFTAASGLEKEDIKAIIAIAEEGVYPAREKGCVCEYDLISRYSEHLRKMIVSAAGDLSGLHVVVDAGNGAGGFFASQVLAPLGCDISGSQFLEPDGHFPNHQPNPENKEAMASISKAVKENGADLGIIFDTDVDRSSAVDSQGREIARNGIVALAASLVAEEFPGSTVVTDSITSPQLKEFLEEKLQMKHFRFKRGYRNVINKGMEIEDCHLAIETSGHAAIRENYFLDDGAYLATKIVIKAVELKRQGKAIDFMIKDLEEALEAKEIRIKIDCEDFKAYGQRILSEFTLEEGWSFEEPNYEGIRVNTPEGWFLMRLSLHDPILPINMESNREGGVAKMEEKILSKLAAYDQLKR